MSEEMLKNKILSRIDRERIVPKSRWSFLLKDYVVWGVGILSLVLGGLSVSVSVYMFQTNDWGLYANTGNSLLSFIIFTLPYVWFFAIALFVSVARYNISHTKNGYRYRLSTIVISLVVLSVLLGFSAHGLGLGKAIDDTLVEKAPIYERIVNLKRDVWNNPGKGLLSGTILGGVENKQFHLRDFGNKEWDVYTEKLPERAVGQLRAGVRVKMFGEVIGESEFKPNSIRPWREEFRPLKRIEDKLKRNERKKSPMRNNMQRGDEKQSPGPKLNTL